MLDSDSDSSNMSSRSRRRRRTPRSSSHTASGAGIDTPREESKRGRRKRTPDNGTPRHDAGAKPKSASPQKDMASPMSPPSPEPQKPPSLRLDEANVLDLLGALISLLVMAIMFALKMMRTVLSCVFGVIARRPTINLMMWLLLLLPFAAAYQYMTGKTVFSLLGSVISVWNVFSRGNSLGGEASNKPPFVYNPPRHGGVLEGLSSQSYVFRQTHAKILALPDIPEKGMLTTRTHSIHRSFSQLMKDYEHCYIEFRDNEMRFAHQMFDRSESLSAYETRRSPEAPIKKVWKAWFTAPGTWQAGSLVDIASLTLDQLSAYGPGLNESISCFEETVEDMRRLHQVLDDQEYDVEKVNTNSLALKKSLANIKSTIRMSIEIIKAAIIKLRNELNPLKHLIEESPGHLAGIRAALVGLKRVIKDGADDAKEKESLESAMQRVFTWALAGKVKNKSAV